MHIGLLTPEYPHPRVLSSAGIGTSIRNLAIALATERVTVSIFIYGQKEDTIISEGRIKLHLIRQRNFRLGGWYVYRIFLQNYLNKYITQDKIDAIEAPDWTGITAFMKLRCPLVIRMHGTDAYFCYLEMRKQKRKNRLFEGVALKNADALVSVSKFTAELTKDIFNMKEEISVIPNSIEVDKFQLKAKKGDSERILYFGTIIRKKGVLELAEIFNEVVVKKPNAELIFIGKDSIDVFENVSTLKLVRDRLNPAAIQNFSYLNEVDYSEIKEYITDAEVIVLPSFAEALPMTWLEAMAMEKALVTSNIGWAKEVMINGVTGFTEDPEDHTAYAEKVIYFLDNPEEAAKMGRAARAQVLRKFASKVIVQKNIEFYKRFVIE